MSQCSLSTIGQDDQQILTLPHRCCLLRFDRRSAHATTAPATTIRPESFHRARDRSHVDLRPPTTSARLFAALLKTLPFATCMPPGIALRLRAQVAQGEPVTGRSGSSGRARTDPVPGRVDVEPTPQTGSARHSRGPATGSCVPGESRGRWARHGRSGGSRA